MDLVEVLAKMGREAGGDGRAILTVNVNGKIEPGQKAPAPYEASELARVEVSLFVSVPNGSSIAADGRTVEEVLRKAQHRLKLLAADRLTRQIQRNSVEAETLARRIHRDSDLLLELAGA